MNVRVDAANGVDTRIGLFQQNSGGSLLICSRIEIINWNLSFTPSYFTPSSAKFCTKITQLNQTTFILDAFNGLRV